MKLRLFLKNLAKAALNSLILINLLLFFAGCSSSTSPTYLQENIGPAIQKICKEEYGFDVKCRRVGSTLWVYLPLKKLLIESKKKEKNKKIEFEIEKLRVEYLDRINTLDYAVRPIRPQEKQPNNMAYSKEAMEKINNVLKVIRRVLFSTAYSKKEETKFFCIVTADIELGFKIEELSYYEDLRKVSYDFISWEEYQHRLISKVVPAPELINDINGDNLDYRDFTIEDFVAMQIEHRITLKFDTPEVHQPVDIDEEILKIAVSTIKTYNVRSFSEVELHNLLTKRRTIFNRPAIFSKSKEYEF